MVIMPNRHGNTCQRRICRLALEYADIALDAREASLDELKEPSWGINIREKGQKQSGKQAYIAGTVALPPAAKFTL
jgi:hypothetical protein